MEGGARPTRSGRGLTTLRGLQYLLSSSTHRTPILPLAGRGFNAGDCGSSRKEIGEMPGRLAGDGARASGLRSVNGTTGGVQRARRRRTRAIQRGRGLVTWVPLLDLVLVLHLPQPPPAARRTGSEFCGHLDGVRRNGDGWMARDGPGMTVCPAIPHASAPACARGDQSLTAAPSTWQTC